MVVGVVVGVVVGFPLSVAESSPAPTTPPHAVVPAQHPYDETPWTVGRAWWGVVVVDGGTGAKRVVVVVDELAYARQKKAQKSKRAKAKPYDR